MFTNLLHRFAILAFVAVAGASQAESPREIINKAVLSEDAEEQANLIATLTGNSAPEIPQLLTAWKESAIYIYSLPQSAAEDAPTDRVAITLTGAPGADGKQAALRLDNTQPLKNFKGEPVKL